MKAFTYTTLVMLFLSSCAEDETNALELEGVWITEKYIDKETGVSEVVPQTFFSSIEFQGDDEIVVNTFCNSGSGNVKIEGGDIKVLDLGMTEIACEMMEDYEFRFTSNLSGSYLVDGDVLNIISNNDTDLYLVRQSEESATVRSIASQL